MELWSMRDMMPLNSFLMLTMQEQMNLSMEYAMFNQSNLLATGVIGKNCQ